MIWALLEQNWDVWRNDDKAIRSLFHQPRNSNYSHKCWFHLHRVYWYDGWMAAFLYTGFLAERNFLGYDMRLVLHCWHSFVCANDNFDHPNYSLCLHFPMHPFMQSGHLQVFLNFTGPPKWALRRAGVWYFFQSGVGSLFYFYWAYLLRRPSSAVSDSCNLPLPSILDWQIPASPSFQKAPSIRHIHPR